MFLQDIEQHLTRWYVEGTSVHFESGPGVGKSSIMEAAPGIVGKALGKNLGITIINGAQLTPMHTLGFGVPKHHDGWSQMVFTDPFFMTTREGKRLSEYDGGWVFVDEADKADVDVKKILGEGALSGRFGPHELPSGWQLWTAGNRTSDRSGSSKELDHLINRRKRITVQPHIPSWVAWANRNGALPITKSFVEAYSQIVASDKVPDKQGPWPTFRSIMLVDRMLQTVLQFYNEIPDEPFVQEEIAGLIGDAATNQFMVHLKLELKLPKFDQIVKDPDGTAVPGSDAPDARMLVCYNAAHNVCKKTIEPVVTYIKRLPEPFAVTFAKAAMQRDPMLGVTPTMQNWISANNALMTLMHSLQIAK